MGCIAKNGDTMREKVRDMGFDEEETLKDPLETGID